MRSTSLADDDTAGAVCALASAGAVEAAFLWLTLSPEWNRDGLLPPHLWDGIADPALPSLALAPPGSRLAGRAGLSNSFAFGGNNCAVVLGRVSS